MNIKDIAATLAILGSGTLVMTGCGKEQPATEVPGGEEAAPGGEAEASCSADEHPAEGHCGGEDGGEEAEGSCSAEGGEGSCSGEKAEGSCSAAE